MGNTAASLNFLYQLIFLIYDGFNQIFSHPHVELGLRANRRLCWRSSSCRFGKTRISSARYILDWIFFMVQLSRNQTFLTWSNGVTHPGHIWLDPGVDRWSDQTPCVRTKWHNSNLPPSVRGILVDEGSTTVTLPIYHWLIQRKHIHKFAPYAARGLIRVFGANWRWRYGSRSKPFHAFRVSDDSVRHEF